MYGPANIMLGHNKNLGRRLKSLDQPSRKPQRCIVQIVGPRDSGKTNSIVKASRVLKEKGLKVAVVKHTHHQIDIKGKDSWRFINEGGAIAAAIIRGLGEEVAIFIPNTELDKILEMFFKIADVVIIEGFKGSNVEVFATISTEEIRDKDLADLIVEQVRRCLESIAPTFPR
jgi:molybdopterin-guanine dinucleotide biosynthesis protein B